MWTTQYFSDLSSTINKRERLIWPNDLSAVNSDLSKIKSEKFVWPAFFLHYQHAISPHWNSYISYNAKRKKLLKNQYNLSLVIISLLRINLVLIMYRKESFDVDLFGTINAITNIRATWCMLNRCGHSYQSSKNTLLWRSFIALYTMVTAFELWMKCYKYDHSNEN